MKRILVLFLLLMGTSGWGQDFFFPVAHYFGRGEYGADSQNWSIVVGPDGMVYVGNNRGLLTFDGYRWELYFVPGGRPVRSLLWHGGRLYSGAHNEFGYWTRSDTGALEYTSLSDRVEGYQPYNEEIWKILPVGDKVVFQSFRYWFVLEGSRVSATPVQSFMLSFNLLEGKPIVSLRNEGFYTAGTEGGAQFQKEGLYSISLEKGDFSPFPAEVPFKSHVISCVPCDEKVPGGGTFVLTYADGVWLYRDGRFHPFRTEADALLKTAQPRDAVYSSRTGDLLIATRQSGVLSITSEGKLKYHMDAGNILYDNICLRLALDQRGSLWIAMDEGITCLRTPREVTHLPSFTPAVGAINTAVVQFPYIYLGTAHGLYRGRLLGDNAGIEQLEAIPEIRQNVQNLSVFDGQVFCGTNGYPYEITPQGVRKMADQSGGSEMCAGRIHGEDVLVQGTYSDLLIYRKKNGRWEFSHFVKGFMNPVRSLQIDASGTIWAAHIYGGLFSIELSEDLQEAVSVKRFSNLYDQKDLPVQISRFRDRLLFSDGKTGIFTYDENLGEMRPFERLSSFPQVRFIMHAYDTRYFFFSDKDLFLVEASTDKLRVLDHFTYEQLGGRTVDGVQRTVPMGNKCFLFLRENALSLYRAEIADRWDTLESPLALSLVTARNYSLGEEKLLPRVSSSHPRLPYRWHNLTFTFRSEHPNIFAPAKFRYRLRGAGDSWHTVEGSPRIEFNYLSAGSYVLEFEELSVLNQTMSSVSYPFTIRRPLYRSIVALLLYACLLALLAGWLIYLREKHLRLKKIEEQAKLQSDNLASSTMRLVHEQQTLTRIRELLVGQKEKFTEPSEMDFREILSLIDSCINSDDNWEAFRVNFDHAHHDFFRKLRSRFPELTDGDMRFCAYFYMNLSTKEIASIMNITSRGVEAARGRIRKKFGLAPEDSLSAFLLTFK